MNFNPQLVPSEGFSVLQSTERSQTATMVLQPQEATGGPHNEHSISDQWLFVLSGEGRAVVGSEAVELGPGALLLIEAGETHDIKNTGDRPLETLNFYAPPEY
jgi:mannose-6-phosphate isomerase-like protein (cupin superfamily)